MARETLQIRFPIFNNVSYIDIIKNKQTLKTYSGKDINGLKWRDLSIKIGKDINAGVFRYALQMENDDRVYNGTIRGVNPLKPAKDDSQSNLKDEIDNLSSKLDRLSSNNNNVGIDVLLSITKQGYETQIAFLNQQLNKKDIDIQKLEREIEKLNDELDTCYDKIDELNKHTGVAQYIELAKDFIKLKTPGNVPKVSLKDSNSSDIPKQILDLLGVVDWSKVEDNIVNEIVKYLNMFIPKLPLKG